VSHFAFTLFGLATIGSALEIGDVTSIYSAVLPNVKKKEPIRAAHQLNDLCEEIQNNLTKAALVFPVIIFFSQSMLLRCKTFKKKS